MAPHIRPQQQQGLSNFLVIFVIKLAIFGEETYNTVHLVINRQFCMASFFSRGNRFLFSETFVIQNLSDKLNSHEQGVQNLSVRFFLTIIFQKL